MIKASLAFLFLCATPALAGPDRVSLTLGSNHIGATGFNQFNPGIFATWEQPRVHWTIGAYHNSYNRTSVAATGYIPLLSWRDGNAGLFAGVAHYPINGRSFTTYLGHDIVAIGGIQIRHRNTFIQLTPMNGKPVKALVSFGITWPLAK